MRTRLRRWTPRRKRGSIIDWRLISVATHERVKRNRQDMSGFRGVTAGAVHFYRAKNVERGLTFEGLLFRVWDSHSRGVVMIRVRVSPQFTREAGIAVLINESVLARLKRYGLVCVFGHIGSMGRQRNNGRLEWWQVGFGSSGGRSCCVETQRARQSHRIPEVSATRRASVGFPLEPDHPGRYWWLQCPTRPNILVFLDHHSHNPGGVFEGYQ